MANVTWDSSFEKGNNAATSPFTFTSNAGTTSGTVGSNTNRVLIASVGFGNTFVSGVAVSWNGSSMTQIGTVDTAGARHHYLFGQINPATGNSGLSVTWSPGSANDVALGAISLFNCDQTTGWQNATTFTGTSSPATINIATASGNMVVAGRTDDNSSGRSMASGTQAWDEGTLDGNYGAGYQGSSSNTGTIAWTMGTPAAWAMVGVDVIAVSSAAAAYVPQTIIPQLLHGLLTQ